MKEITSEELLSFNGKDGKPVYIAYQGKVYDVSKSPLWSKGLHMNRHPSGKDLSGEILAAPHGAEVFERYPEVGVWADLCRRRQPDYCCATSQPECERQK